MNLGRQQEIFTQALALLLQYSNFRGYQIRMGQVERSVLEAERLGFENSNHTRRLAADLHLFRGGKYLQETDDHILLGEFWERLSGFYDDVPLVFAWGGRFGDGNHYSIEHKGVI